MLDVFINVIMPVFLVAVLAAAFQRWRKAPVGPLAQVTLYLLTPALIFTALVDQEIPASASVRIVAAILLANAFIIAASLLASLALRHDRAMRSAFVLSTGFPNAGNLSLPVLLLAFGDEGLAVGVIVFVTMAILGQSLGVVIAAGSSLSLAASVKQVFKLPAIYGIIAALVVRATGVDLPPVVDTPIEMLAQASIPMMLVVLGFQLGGEIRLERPASLSAAVVMRLLASAPLGYLSAMLLGLDDLTRGVVAVVYAMPVAVFTIILATEFRTNPRFVTNAVVISTLASALTLAAVIQVVKDLVIG